VQLSVRNHVTDQADTEAWNPVERAGSLLSYPQFTALQSSPFQPTAASPLQSLLDTVDRVSLSIAFL
jgi:hypothetical protein